MPCNDTTSRIVINLDFNNRLHSFDFFKMTCGKEISGETGFKEYCLGKTVEEVLELEFDTTLYALNLEDPDQQFFFFMEWEAIRAALTIYSGKEDPSRLDRFQIASIEYGGKGVEIRQNILKPGNMPPVKACITRVSH